MAIQIKFKNKFFEELYGHVNYGVSPDDQFILITQEAVGKAKESVIEVFGSETGYSIDSVMFCQDEMNITYVHGNDNAIELRLNKEAYKNKQQMYFQIGHEILHWVSPIGYLHASYGTVLEEGLAEWHARHFVMANNMGEMHSVGENYQYARKLVDELVKSCGIGIIKIIRKEIRFISHITARDLLDACPGLDQNLAINLAARFKY